MITRTLVLSLVLTTFASAAEPPKLVGYFASWGIHPPKNYQVADIPGEKLTHVNYAFILIDKDGNLVADDPKSANTIFAQLRGHKAKHPHLKTLISIGGWSGSARFSDIAVSNESRTKFSAKCVDFIVKHGFDGVDIDWEFPVTGGAPGNAKRPEDRQNFTLLLQAIRKDLNERAKLDNRPYLLTIAAPALPPTASHIDLVDVAAMLDWINVMTYDFAGSWTGYANFQAALFDPGNPRDKRRADVDASATYYLKAGVPPEKIVIGVPFYGRGWVVADDKNDGLFSTPAKTPPRRLSPGFGIDYRELSGHYTAAKHGWNDRAHAPYLFDAKQHLFIGYDDEQSMREKANYVLEKKLGGIMIWELGADNNKRSLFHALAESPLYSPSTK